VPLHLIGLVSDTHGLVRPQLHAVLAGVELILHAGDVGGDDVLDELALIAPVHAVRGNTDDPHDARLAESLEITIGGVRIHVSHGHEVGSPTPARLLLHYSADVVVYGHTHRQMVTQVGEQLCVNPGAAGAQRFKLSPSVALLRISEGRGAVEIVELPA